MGLVEAAARGPALERVVKSKDRRVQWSGAARAWLTVAAIAMGGFALAAHAASTAADEAARLFSSGDPKVVREDAIEFVMRNARDPSVLAFARSVWAGDRKAYPGLAWSTLEQPAARIALANALAFAVKASSRCDEAGTREIESIRRDVVARAADPSGDVRASVAAFLGGGGAREVPQLRAMVDDQDASVGQVAVTALVPLAGETREARLAYLATLRPQVRNPKVQASIDRIAQTLRDRPDSLYAMQPFGWNCQGK
jgi:hypothetical protein